MWKLMVRYGEAGEADFPLVGELVVGRTAECQIWFDQPEVSRRHARFYLVERGAFVDDLGSANGVFLNSSRVEGTAELRPGDILLVGGHKLLVTWAGDGAAPPAREHEETGHTVAVDHRGGVPEPLDEDRPFTDGPPATKPLTRAEPPADTDEEAADAPAKKSGCFTLVAVAALALALVVWCWV
jgi:pSer/pThr/pTyr-binding forkhead associated (FHA) protein